MADRYPLTIEQTRQTKQDLEEMAQRAAETARLMLAAYGESDPRTVRAQEVEAAIQRLQWEIQRVQAASH